LYGHMLVNFCYYLFCLLESFVGIVMFSAVFGYLLDEFEKFVV
jgi:F0F1-type ATP synthase assembly protein I